MQRSMALRSKLRSLVLHRNRVFCTSIVSTDPKTLPNSTEKTRAVLFHLRFEQNPDRILDICRSAALTPESHLDRIAYSKIVSKLRESNYPGIGDFIKESMDQIACKSERVLAHFIVLYGHARLAKDAVNLFDEMPALGVERDVKTLNSLLFACDLAGEYSEMRRVYLEFPRKYQLEPNLDTYNIALKGFCSSGSANEAHSILAEMERKSIRPNATTFATVIAGFYKEEKFESVGKIMELMKKYGIPPGISIYNVRIQSLCKLKRSTEAKALLDGILSRGMKPNSMTYSHLIYGFCREGNLEMAKSLFKDMVGRGFEPGVKCYFTMVYYLCEGGDFEVALAICEECLEKGWVPNFSTMKALVMGLVSIGKADVAKKIIQQVKGKFSRNTDTWVEIEEKIPS
ncbi:hypothetical protein ACP275_13G144300 [Erythranthe tilingii]